MMLVEKQILAITEEYQQGIYKLIYTIIIILCIYLIIFMSLGCLKWKIKLPDFKLWLSY